MIVGTFHLIFSIPALYLHIEYYLRNAGETIEVKPGGIVIFENDKEHRYDTENVSKIIVYKAASLDKFGIPFSAIEYYRYIRIITKSGEEIIITCLMTRKIDEVIKQLSGVSYERKKSCFCALKWK